MADDFNPYQPPEAPVAEDFIAVEPRRRPMIYTIAAALCWFMGVALLVSIGVVIAFVIQAVGNRGWEPLAKHVSVGLGLILLATMGVVIFCYIAAGRAFSRSQGRRGMILVLIAMVLSSLVSMLKSEIIHVDPEIGIAMVLSSLVSMLNLYP